MTASPTDPAAGRVHRDVRDGVLVLRLDDEPSLNALTSTMLSDLAAAIAGSSEDPAVRGVVVTGTGRAFSSGENLRETSAVVETHGIAELSRLFNAVTDAVLRSSVPCVAALNGIAVGGAAELTLCFDRRIGTPDAAVLLPESRMGFTISNGASRLLPDLVGRSRATELVLCGRKVGAEEALAIGLVDEIVAPDDLLARSIEFVHRATPEGHTAHLHLAMLRPSLADVEAAYAVEAAAAREAWDSGAMAAKIAEFDRP